MTTSATVNQKGGVNVREKMSTSSRKLGTLSRGTTVNYYSDKNGWLEIDHNSTRAYIMKKFTDAGSDPAETPTSKPEDPVARPEDPTAKPEDTTAKPEETVINSGSLMVSSLNVRKEPKDNAGKLGSLTGKGKKFNVYEDNGEWLKIDFGKKKGWIRKEYTSLCEVNEASAAGQTVVNHMRQFLSPHHPYVWAGKGSILTKELIRKLKSNKDNSKWFKSYDALEKNNPDIYNGSYRAFDCTGFACWNYKAALGKDISSGNAGNRPTAAKAIKKYGKEVFQAQLKIGDVVDMPGHVVVYSGNGRCIECASKNGVYEGHNWDYVKPRNVWRFV